jgi:hypothetical protein
MNRRTFLVSSLAAAAAACGRARGVSPARVQQTGTESTAAPVTPTATAAPQATATPAPPPAHPRGVEERALMPGTPWETRLFIQHSGVRGPAAMVLGGVHGNEPGGWRAADDIATWAPAAGTLIVVPRANVQAIAGFVRTTDELGDLNRLYPGDPASPLPMERMTAAILAAAREFDAKLLLDMHESWAFYVDYPGTGTGALGQTITTGAGPLYPAFGQDVASRVNPGISEHERMLVRDGQQFRRPEATPAAGQTNRGRSSLSAGGHVDGLTPVLVEMGQQNQPVARRVELHLLVARTALDMLHTT